MPKARGFLVSGLVVLALAVVVVFLGLMWPAEATAAFAGVALVAAAFAAWLAWLAVRYARPGYDEWRQQQVTPDVELKLFAGTPNRGRMREVTGGELDVVGYEKFAFRVEVHNHGPATVRSAVLNVVAEGTIQSEREGFHASEWPDFNDELVPGKNLPVHLAAAERDFPPEHVYKYIGVVHSGFGDHPVLAVLEGSPGVSVRERWTVHVRAPT